MLEQWEVFGHQAVKNLLQVQLEAGRLSHAYLFRGPEEVGKKTLAKEFACKILMTNSLNNHPDFSLLDEQTEITVEQIHEFMHGLAFKPFAGAKKVAIINNAQNLNTQSGNALLKTLEEPSDSTVIILVAGGFVLPTIVSRCQTFYFYPSSQAQLNEYALAHNIDGKLLAFSFGRLGRLQRLSEEPKMLAQTQEQVGGLEKLLDSSVNYKLSKVSEYAELEPSDLQQLLRTWMLWLRQAVSTKPQLFKALQACANATDGLQNNQNKKLALQSLFLKI